ncbi:putative OB-fold protein [Lachnospiraceae bacterium PF1-22]
MDKKVIIIWQPEPIGENAYFCPHCGEEVFPNSICSDCGGRINWSEVFLQKEITE